MTDTTGDSLDGTRLPRVTRLPDHAAQAPASRERGAAVVASVAHRRGQGSAGRAPDVPRDGGGEGTSAVPAGPARGRGRSGRLVRAVTAAALALVTAAALAAPAVAAPGTATGGKGLRWEACAGVSTPDLRCARVTVPLDHRRPRGRTISVVISRLPATDPARRRGVLLTTGGGPGGPGVPLPVSLAPGRRDRSVWGREQPARHDERERGCRPSAGGECVEGDA
ncbi:hypothetical protein [Streptosporangium vulgare]|uniref:hypothetical protein n=1 Tax=Streptosporangium vulgare TaxID=46190 RepID=UPI0031CDF0BE